MKLSIITINYNNKAGLEKTVASVMAQTWRDFEWIIIDGGSTDGSAEVIAELAKKPETNIRYWCSEPDKGIYNAMNKGIAHAHGEYLQFLNSGDFLIDDNVVEEFCKLQYVEDIIGGDIILNGNIDTMFRNPEESRIDFDYMIYGTLSHPSSYIKRILFDRYGGYDESLKIVADWKFFLVVLIQYSCTYKKWDRVIADYNTDGLSALPEMQELHKAERKKVLDSFLPRCRKSIEKRDKRIMSLDLPIKVLIQQRIKNRISRFLNFIKL